MQYWNSENNVRFEALLAIPKSNGNLILGKEIKFPQKQNCFLYWGNLALDLNRLFGCFETKRLIIIEYVLVNILFNIQCSIVSPDSVLVEEVEQIN